MKYLYKLWFLILIISLLPLITNGQNEYYSTDSTTLSGIKLVDGGDIYNARFCQVKEGEKIIKYSPDEVAEFGFKDGRVYISRKIKINNEEKKVFLERLNKGKMNLYYYKDKKGKKFFLEKDRGQLVEILKKETNSRNYKDILKSYIQDCDNVIDALELVTYNKSSLSKFTDQYNSCLHKPFPFIRYGLTFGYSSTKPINSKISNELLRDVVFKNDNSVNVGIFMDIPILLSSFSLHPEVYFQKNAFSSYSAVNNGTKDVMINTTSVNIPLLIRYTYPSLKLQPFINIGSTFVYNLRNNNMVYTTTISNNIVEIEEPNSGIIYSEKQIGYTVGGGIQYNIDYRKSLFFELRYNNLYGTTKETFGNKSFQCIFGIKF